VQRERFEKVLLSEVLGHGSRHVLHLGQKLGQSIRDGVRLVCQSVTEEIRAAVQSRRKLLPIFLNDQNCISNAQ
jgi:hypothetical protein